MQDNTAQASLLVDYRLNKHVATCRYYVNYSKLVTVSEVGVSVVALKQNKDEARNEVDPKTMAEEFCDLKV